MNKKTFENKPLIGRHLPYLKDSQLLGTLKEALIIGATSGAMYVSNSRKYSKFELNEEKINEAIALAKVNNFNIENFIVHSPLVGNLASTDEEKNIFQSTLNSYIEDLKIMSKIGLKYYNFHPGSIKNREVGIKRIAEGINEMHKQTKSDNTIVLLETMMAKGNYIGRNFADLADIIKIVKDKERVGICLDTCHVWDAGYDIKTDLDGVLKKFDNVIGLKYLKALHINDSKNELGSNKDRHENIGDGFIGLKALKEIVNHPQLRDLPKALETPYVLGEYDIWKKELKLLVD